MEPNKCKQKQFENAAMKALKSGKYDFFRIMPKQTIATLCKSKVSRIQNAFVLIKNADGAQEWTVENYEVVYCPDELCVCLKSLKELLGCIGNHNNEDCYFVIDGDEEAPIQDEVIFGVVEVEECTSVFYYNGRTRESYYINLPSYEEESADLFALVNKLKELEEEINEKTSQSGDGLEKAEEFLWV